MGRDWTSIVGDSRVRKAAPWLLLVGVALAPIAPRGCVIALLLIIAALLASTVERLRGFRPELGATIVALLLLGAYLAVNASWSVSVGEAYGKVLFFLLATLLAATGIAAVSRLDSGFLDRAAAAIAAGVSIGAAFLLIEVLLDQPIARTIGTLLPFARPPPKHAVIVDGRVLSIVDYRLNRNVAVLCLLLFPALLAAKAVLSPTRWRVAAAALVAATAAVVFQSEHETSMIAFVLAAATFIGMQIAPLAMRRAVLAGWVVATMLVMPLALASYGVGLHKAEWLPVTGRNRIILWHQTATEWRKAPVLGVGVASTRDLDLKAAPTAVRPEGYTYSLRTGRHAHNIFLQTWYELGLAGAVLLLVAGLALLDALRRLPRTQMPYAYATFVMAVVTSCFSWGMWQTWFLAAFALTAVLTSATLEAQERREAGATGGPGG